MRLTYLDYMRQLKEANMKDEYSSYAEDKKED